MKKLLLILIVVSFVFSFTVVSANNDIQVKIDGTLIEFDVAPQVINNRTMVPVRKIFESLGANVEWNNNTQTVTSSKNSDVVKLTLDKDIMYVNDIEIMLDSPACVVEQRTLVPVRAVSEAFKCEVFWNSDNSTVYITTNPEICKSGHRWSKETCTSAKTCINCKIEVGKPLGHDLTNPTTIRNATCSTTGIQKGYCTNCKKLLLEVEIPKLEHILGMLEVVPTQTSIGKKVKKCTLCNQICYEEEYVKNEYQEKMDYRYFCHLYDYPSLLKVADVQKGNKARVIGSVMQVIEEEDFLIYLIEITKNSFTWDDIVMIRYERNSIDPRRFGEDAVIEACGEIGGLITYETVSGNSNTVPLINAKYIDEGYIINYD